MMRVGMAQMYVEGGAPDANLKRACRMIAAAGEQGADAVVLPECLDLGWTHPCARELAVPVPGPRSDRLIRAARESGVYVAAGLVESARGRIYNSAVLISPEGDVLLKHRKINELDIALDLYSTGDRLGVAETPLGRLGILICADNFPDSLHLARSLRHMGCKLLLSPCAWAVDAGHDNALNPYGELWMSAYGEIARGGMTVVGVSNVGWLTAGPWAGRKCIGCSLAVGTGGVLAQLPYGENAEALVMVEV
ncbi:MAG TPA: carbon-nitrogen hydrolase family protein [Bryobacteraceae bacterium]|nr:carbon-nitrogen hydrolase family protein [Bryobacteraceae bacterium]